MAEREKGVATRPCPNCGAELNPVDQPDGAVAYETCSNCYPTESSTEPVSEKASRATRRETGTNVTTETTGRDEN